MSSLTGLGLCPLFRVTVTSVLWWQRGVDLCCSFLLLPVLAACTTWIAICMRCRSPGPVIYTQERVGRLGRRFRIYRFRTVRVSIEPGEVRSDLAASGQTRSGATTAGSPLSPPLVPGGWLLRRNGIERLPEIVNVLRGEMSLFESGAEIPAASGGFSSPARNRHTS